ncbi:hypothetical protein EDD17DRAFT_1502793 [Pisolithus thermaeus]|nr:hypothetical protein EDD17DRAFT_1502793 [Pisolithus thermaeus]
MAIGWVHCNGLWGSELRAIQLMIARAFTWWHDKNSTMLWAGQLVSISRTLSTAQLVLSMKAMDMEVKKSDDKSSKDLISGQIITLGGIKSKKHETMWGSYLPEQLAHLGQGQKGIQGKETCDVPKKFIGKLPDEASVPSWGDQGSSARNLGRRTKHQIMILTIFVLQR